MRVQPLGESAVLVSDLGTVEAWSVADRLHDHAFPGFIDAAAAYETIGIYFDPELVGEAVLREAIEAAVLSARGAAPGVLHEISVCYEMGEDLDMVAEFLGLRREMIAEWHCSNEYRCAAVGFQPGFPYLGDLPDAISGVPRRPSPRVRVPAGSVGITGRQTGIYPAESPGGWALIGRTPLTIVSVEEGHFRIRAGDRVRFRQIDGAEFESLRGKRL